MRSRNYSYDITRPHVPDPLDETSTVLEEGLATDFQRFIRDEWALGAARPSKAALPEYEEAEKYVTELLDFDKDAIKKLRQNSQSSDL